MDESNQMEITNSLTTANHYGNMRFAMFTVHLTLVGSIAYSLVSKDLNLLDEFNFKFLISVAGMVLSLLFGLSQNRINELVIIYQEHAYELKAIKKPEDHKCGKKIAITSMLIPYFFHSLSSL